MQDKKLGHNSKASIFHSSCPLIHEQIREKINFTSIKLSIDIHIHVYEVKSPLKSYVKRIILFITQSVPLNLLYERVDGVRFSWATFLFNYRS